MSRTLSAAMRAALNGQETDEVPICLLTISHADLAEPLYLASAAVDRLSSDPLIYGVTSRGNEYLFLPFDYSLPDDKDDSPPRVALILDNIDRTLVTIVRSFSTPPDVLLEVVLASDPDFVEIAMPQLQLSNVSIGDQVITAELLADSLVNEPHPAGLYTPGAFPGIF